MSIGFLPFNSGDSSVILEDPLTSFPTWVADGDATSDLSTATGANFNANGFSPNGAYLRFTGMVGWTGTKDNGQISFDVEKEWLCVTDNTNGSFGDTLVATEALLELQTTSNFNMALQAGSGAITETRPSWASNLIRNNAITGVTAYPNLTTQGKGAYVRVGIGWITSGLNIDMVFMVDGVVLTKQSYVKATINESFNEIWVGARSGTDIMGDYRIKNLVISDEAPVFTTDRKILLFGDSQVRGHSLTSPSYYDVNQGWNMLRGLQSRGIYIDSSQVVIDRNPGEKISASGGAGALSNIIGASLSANNPTDVVIVGGINDCNTAVPSDFQSSLDSMVSEAVNFSTVERVAIVNVRSFIADSNFDIPTNRSNRDTVNLAIETAGVPLVNALTLQGDSLTLPDIYTWVGVINATDDLHIAVSAAGREGTAYAFAIDSQAPILTTPYSNLINIFGDVVNVDLTGHIAGATSIDYSMFPATLSESANVVTGTVTSPTGRTTVLVTGTNSFGSITERFEWDTLTIGAASNINTDINT